MPVLNPIPELDDSTLAYVLAAQPPFEDLRQAVGQLSGWLVLAALRTADASADHPALARAATLVRDCHDQLRDMRTTARGRMHHDCLLRAAHTLESAVRDAQARARMHTDDEIQRLTLVVKRAYAELAGATATLPGFEMVSFAHACCARQSRA